MIQLRSVTKTYDGISNVLTNIDLEIYEGEIIALIGPSGSGKTTLLKMLNGLVKPSSGELLYKGQSLNSYDINSLRRKIGYVIQEVGLFPHYTVADNINLVPDLLSYSNEEKMAVVSHWMNLLKLDFKKLASQYPANLSGGQAQRVGLARALAAEPEIILMDEPFSALDPEIRKQIRTDFLKIQKDRSMTAVIVTHDLIEAIEMADRICFISDGVIQQLADPQAFIFKPRNQHVKDFIRYDKYKASLAACSFKDLGQYLEKGFDFLGESSLLSILNEADFEDQKILIEAFNIWKGEIYA